MTRTTSRDPLILPLSSYVKFSFRERPWPAGGVSPPATFATWSSFYTHKCPNWRLFGAGFVSARPQTAHSGHVLIAWPEIAPPSENWLMRRAWIWSVDITRSMSSCPTPYEISELNVLICILSSYWWTFMCQWRGNIWVKLRIFLYITSHDSVFFYQKLKSSVCKKMALNFH